jgi:hypothetical protein
MKFLIVFLGYMDRKGILLFSLSLPFYSVSQCASFRMRIIPQDYHDRQGVQDLYLLLSYCHDLLE